MSDKPIFLRALRGEKTERPPIWLMRQAGRYLPEYRATRAQAGSFLELCYDPKLAAEVTLQPIRRFGFDAAILFADILLVPQALGRKLWFETGEGPRLDPLTRMEEATTGLADDAAMLTALEPIMQTVRLLRADLPAQTPLIGFAGAPWTVATYVIAGRGKDRQQGARNLMRDNPALFSAIIDRLSEATIAYLSAQISAGAQAVKLFDSWAGALNDDEAGFAQAILGPTRRIAQGLRARHPDIPLILFPRGVSQTGVERIVAACAPDCVAIGQEADRRWAARALQPKTCVQGNLDPAHMVTGGDKMERAVRDILSDFSGGPHVFNLGHGITPEADPRHVEHLVRLVKG